jgi:hypothetical protein
MIFALISVLGLVIHIVVEKSVDSAVDNLSKSIENVILHLFAQGLSTENK